MAALGALTSVRWLALSAVAHGTEHMPPQFRNPTRLAAQPLKSVSSSSSKQAWGLLSLTF